MSATSGARDEAPDAERDEAPDAARDAAHDNTPDQAPDASLTNGYFDDVYAANADPWRFTSSAYEAAKYKATMAALPRARYRSAFEIGCSIGVLTLQLADRCDALLAVDVAEAALTQARIRTRDCTNVIIRRLRVPDEDPGGAFDLVMLSEVAYYWTPDDFARAASLIAARLEPGGHLVMVHWTPRVHDYPQTGDAVHDAMIARPEFEHLSGQRESTYRLDVLTRR